MNAGLETELSFFRKIMVPGETGQGIHVERMNVAAGAESTYVIETHIRRVLGVIYVDLVEARYGAAGDTKNQIWRRRRKRK